MAATTITFRVDESERDELVTRAEREKVNLSDYIRVRLGLRGQGPEGDGDIDVDPQHEKGLRDQILDHEQRLRALEDESGRRIAAAPSGR
jgi:hypothetical protein